MILRMYYSTKDSTVFCLSSSVVNVNGHACHYSIIQVNVKHSIKLIP